MTQTSPSGFVRTLEQAETDTEALKLRSLGLTYQKIADRMGCSVQAASDRYHRALAAVPADAVDEHRKLMGEQIDSLLEVAFEQALTGKRSLFAIDRCLTLMDRKARLFGLDAPVKTQTEVVSYSGDTIEAEVAKLRRILSEHGSEPVSVDGSTGEAGPTTS